MTETGGYAYWWVYASTWDKLIAVPVTFEGGGAEFDNPWSLGEIEIDMKAHHLVGPVEPPHREPDDDQLVCQHCGDQVTVTLDPSYGVHAQCGCRAFHIVFTGEQTHEIKHDEPRGVSWADDPYYWKPYWKRWGDDEDA